MTFRRRSPLLRYGLAVGSVAAAFSMSILVPDVGQAAATLFLAAVTLSAWYGGIGPGLLATTISVGLLDYYFIPEIHTVDMGLPVYASLVVFLLVAILINYLNVRRARLELALRVQNRRKRDFMAVLAHELRNFLAPISASLAALELRSAGDAGAEATCAIMARQIRSMTRLVEDLLDVARINEGKIRLSLEPVDLTAVVLHAIACARPSIEARWHRLETSVPAEPLVLEADRTRLEQVLLNLLTNAVTYTDPGGRIGLVLQREPREMVVRIRDNGRGLSPEALPHVFDLFMQAESDSPKGLGIGLSLVRGLVEMHGGSVAAFSPGPGRGTEFVVRLPAPVQAPTHGEVPQPASARQVAQPPSAPHVPQPASARQVAQPPSAPHVPQPASARQVPPPASAPQVPPPVSASQGATAGHAS